jgi:TFIIF-interacting CTD phosphatase-like protein
MKKFNIILDLDQTLISGEPLEEIKEINTKKIKKRCERYEKSKTMHNMDNIYLIFERPHLQQFLDFLFANFNVSVWTAATKSYALFIIKNVIMTKPERQLQYIFFKEHCELSYADNKHSKNLNVLWKNFKIPNMNSNNTFILDDNDEVYETQKNNCIRAPSFEVQKDNSDKDVFLLHLEKQLKTYIKKSKDVSFIQKINKA